MKINNLNISSADLTAVKQAYLIRVFGWMGLGLITTAIVSAFVVTTIGFISPTAFIIAVIAEFYLVYRISRHVFKMTARAAVATFIGYSALNGFTLSGLFIYYAAESIVSAFVISASIFIFMAVYGYTTKKDLSGMGSFMMMGLFGLLVALFVSFIFQNSMLNLIISVLFVIVFTGLTAWDVQNIARSALQMEGSGETVATKGAILGALHLYLNFINIFIHLLHIIGFMRD